MTTTPETDKMSHSMCTSDKCVPADFARKLERERDEANDEMHKSLVKFDQLFDAAEVIRRERDEAILQLEIETNCKEKCIKCGHSLNPSLVESGWCIFCIQRETREARDEANSLKDHYRVACKQASDERDQLRSVCDELAKCLDIGKPYGRLYLATEEANNALTVYNNLPHVKKSLK